MTILKKFLAFVGILLFLLLAVMIPPIGIIVLGIAIARAIKSNADKKKITEEIQERKAAKEKTSQLEDELFG